MTCQKFSDLNPIQKILYIGQLVHCVQSSDLLFEMGEGIIDMGLLKGLFDGVTILPNELQENA